jgi:hypothetical protein
MLKTLTDADIARDGEMASVMVRAGLLRDLIDCATQAPGGGAAPMRQIVAKLAKADCECDAHHGVSNCLSCQARALPQEVEPAAPVKRDLTSGERIEQAAQWLHDEGGFGDAWPNHTWPEHPDDTGQRDGGFVKIVPSDVQAKFREVATRMLRVFPEALSTQAAYPTGAGEGLSVADAWQDLVDKDDRTSPEEYPDMALITREELADYMQAAVTMKEGE